MAELKTGIGFDDIFTEPHCLWDGNHQECPTRIAGVKQKILEDSWIAEKTKIFPGRKATVKELEQFHSQEWIDQMKKTEQMSQMELEKLSMQFDDVYFHPSTCQAAEKAVGCCLDLLEAVWSRKVKNGFAIVRPPGHHAGPSEPCGYCVYNNVVLTAKHALNSLGVQRIVILDWDIHHGQGTQDAFYDDPRVLFISIHRYEDGKFWPNLERSGHSYIGSGNGLGYNVNLPINQLGAQDADYLAILYQVIIPLLVQYDPELILVSAGFDPSIDDPEGDMDVSPNFFAHATHLLKGFAQGRLLLLLEGGYDLESNEECIEVCSRVLCGQSPPRLEVKTRVMERTKETIGNTIASLWSHWPSLGFLPFSQSTSWERPTESASPIISHILPHEKGAIFGKLRRWKGRNIPPVSTCLAYDEDMMEHRRKGHPEDPMRIKRIYSRLKSKNLLDKAILVSKRKATDEEILMVHSKIHLDDMKETIGMPPNLLARKESNFDSVYLNTSSYNSALLASGCLLEVLDSVLNEKTRNGVGIVRPPGHHAEEDEANGFCIFNNVAIAAKYAQRVHGIEKVLIVDWDVHHGNGIQHVFYEDPSVLYVSLHRFDEGTFFPAAPDGNSNFVGEGAGRGFNLNVPWNTQRVRPMGDSEYIAAFCHVIMPVCLEFNPDLVLVSSGFDAALGDPLGGYCVSSATYALMTHFLTSLADGKIILALEGGYNLESISEAMAACVSALKDRPPSQSVQYEACIAFETLRNVLEEMSPFWKSAKDLRFSITPTQPDIQPQSTQDTPSSTHPAHSEDISVTAHENKENTHFESSGMAQAGASAFPNVVDETIAKFIGLELNSEEIQLHAVIPLTDCPHLEQVTPVPPHGIDVKSKCESCGNVGENWICLSCYRVYCGRYVKLHGVVHHIESSHPLCLSFADLSAWCHLCDAYIHNHRLLPAKQAAHRNKFGTEAPV